MLFLLNGELSPILGQPGAAPPAAVAAEVGTAAPPAEAPAGEQGGFNMFWMYGVWALVIVGFYFLTIRPQRKQAKQMKEMQSAIKIGDNVITTGGMFGRIAEIGEDCFLVEYGTNRGVRIPVRKSDVLGIRTPQLTPAPADKKE